jgi:hypothetical protein
MISLNISGCSGFKIHRSGWNYCIASLRPFHSKHGIYVDGFIEDKFSWKIEDYYDDKPTKIPYTRGWIGFVHNPPNPPSWFDLYNSPEAIFSRDVFRKSLDHCLALVCLSDYLADWVKNKCDIPVISVKHPTATNIVKWEPEKFLSKERPVLLQVGYWLRRMISICDVNVPYPYLKKWLPSDYDYANNLLSLEKKTLLHPFNGKSRWSGVEMLKRISNEEYDDTLTSCVVFLDLYDSSANNSVIECIARNTPLLVNRHPAVVEYCGEDYPLYFDSLDHAYELLCDTDKIFSAHEHFKNMNKSWINGSYFANDLTTKLEAVL